MEYSTVNNLEGHISYQLIFVVKIIQMFFSATVAGLHQPDADHTAVCRESLELLSIAFILCPDALVTLSKEKAWQQFITDLLLLTSSQ